MSVMPVPAKKSYSPFNMMSRELLKRGYAINILPLSTKYVEIIAPSGWKWVTRWAALSYPFMSVAAKQISVNKTLGYEFAAYYGVTIPKTLYLPDDKHRLEEFVAGTDRMIVKPVNGSGSHGLTLNITEMLGLQSAITEAEKYSAGVIVQQQFIGDEIRITVAEGEVVSVILRQPLRIIGDGKSTISQLIGAENEARKNLQFEQIPYPYLTSAIIAESILSDQTVTQSGEIIRLSQNSLTSGGASLYDVQAEIHSSYLETACRLVAALNPDFLVVDLMVADYTQPQTDTNYIFVEFNTAPALRLYGGMRDGEPYDMAAKLVDMVDRRSLQS